MSLLTITQQAQEGALTELRYLDKKLAKLQAVETRQRMYSIIELRERLDASENPSYLIGDVHRGLYGYGMGMSIRDSNARQFTFREHDGRMAVTTPPNYDELGI
jgi:hypothetical protein